MGFGGDGLSRQQRCCPYPQRLPALLEVRVPVVDPPPPDSSWFKHIPEMSRGTLSARRCDFTVLLRSCGVKRRTAGLAALSQCLSYRPVR